MVNQIPADAILLQTATNYKPIWVNTSPHLKGEAASKANGAGHYSMPPIFRIHVLSNDNSGNIKLWLYNDDPDEAGDGITIPKTALLVGHTYDMYLNRFEATGITILGYQLKNYPYDLD